MAVFGRGAFRALSAPSDHVEDMELSDAVATDYAADIREYLSDSESSASADEEVASLTSLGEKQPLPPLRRFLSERLAGHMLEVARESGARTQEEVQKFFPG